MRAKHLLLCLLISAGALAAPVASFADSHVSFGIGITVGPPAPPVVVAPAPMAPAPGYVWAPGYYAWNGYQYIWVTGRWIEPRPGFVWVPDRWEHRGPYWHRVDGHWRHEHYAHGYHHR